MRNSQSAKYVAIILAGVLLLQLPAARSASGQEGQPPARTVQGQELPQDDQAALIKAVAAEKSFLVIYKPGRTDACVRNCIALGLTVIKVYAPGRFCVCELPNNVQANQAIAALLRSPSVEEILPNVEVTLLPPPTEMAGPWMGQASANVGATIIPNDQFFGLQWGMRTIRANEAWTAVRESPIVVGLTDTGVDYNHEDLTSNIWTNPYEIPGDGLDNDGNGYVDDVHGVNTIAGTGDPIDENGHGTHCAGVIGAIGNNYAGVAGVNWRVQIMGIRMLHTDKENANGTKSRASAAVEAIDYASQNGAKVISASWGTDEARLWAIFKNAGIDPKLWPDLARRSVQPVADAIARAGARDVLFVCSAGNTGKDIQVVGQRSWPASFADVSTESARENDRTSLQNMIVVASINFDETLAGSSSFGNRAVHIAAPGGRGPDKIPGDGIFDNGIFSTMSAVNEFSGRKQIVNGQEVHLQLNQKYAFSQGTSMAAPHVTGAVALLLGHPNHANLHVRDVKGHLLSHGRKAATLRGKTTTESILDLGFLRAEYTQEPPPITYIQCYVPTCKCGGLVHKLRHR